MRKIVKLLIKFRTDYQGIRVRLNKKKMIEKML